MKLNTLTEQQYQEIITYKWMSGSNWFVHTKEGSKKVGDTIIPLYVGANMEVMPMYFSLIYNNHDPNDEMYLAVIKTRYHSDAKTEQGYTTLDYDFSTDHPVGSKAVNMGDEEGLIMHPSKLIDLYRATLNENHDEVSLVNKQGKLFTMSI
jgi:hypothetical protein